MKTWHFVMALCATGALAAFCTTKKSTDDGGGGSGNTNNTTTTTWTTTWTNTTTTSWTTTTTTSAGCQQTMPAGVGNTDAACEAYLQEYCCNEFTDFSVSLSQATYDTLVACIQSAQQQTQSNECFYQICDTTVDIGGTAYSIGYFVLQEQADCAATSCCTQYHACFDDPICADCLVDSDNNPSNDQANCDAVTADEDLDACLTAAGC